MPGEGFKIGIDRFIFNSWAFVVVGSGRRALIDGRVPKFRCRMGVDGVGTVAREGVDGVGMLDMEDCAECPLRREGARLDRWSALPLSETGSRVEPEDPRS